MHPLRDRPRIDVVAGSTISGYNVAPVLSVISVLVPVGAIVCVPGSTQIVMYWFAGKALIAAIAALMVAKGRPPMYAVESFP